MAIIPHIHRKAFTHIHSISNTNFLLTLTLYKPDLPSTSLLASFTILGHSRRWPNSVNQIYNVVVTLDIGPYSAFTMPVCLHIYTQRMNLLDLIKSLTYATNF